MWFIWHKLSSVLSVQSIVFRVSCNLIYCRKNRLAKLSMSRTTPYSLNISTLVLFLESSILILWYQLASVLSVQSSESWVQYNLSFCWKFLFSNLSSSRMTSYWIRFFIIFYFLDSLRRILWHKSSSGLTVEST